MAFYGDMLIKFEFEVKIDDFSDEPDDVGGDGFYVILGGMVYEMMMEPVVTLWMILMSVVPWVIGTGPLLYQGKV